MPELFKLKEKKFSEKDKEWQWSYQCLFTLIFNQIEIRQITITDHYQQEHSDIDNELILKLLTKLNEENLKPMKYEGQREPYEWEVIYDEKPYILFFWFDDYNSHGLWIRNCHRID